MRTYLQYILEIRQRLIFIFTLFIVVFLGLLVVANKCYNYLAAPFLAQGLGQLIATNVTSGFTAPLQLAMYLSWLCCMPVILYQLWAFIAPALLPQEKNIIRPMTMLSVSLFYLGVMFGFKIICPLSLKFFIATTPKQVTLIPDITSYLSFISTIAFASGVAFQTPIITSILRQLNIINYQNLNKLRRIVLLLAFTLGMLLTPPDVVSQVLLALPIYALFEIGIIIDKIINKPKATKLIPN